jgi:hypothetical protein
VAVVSPPPPGLSSSLRCGRSTWTCGFAGGEVAALTDVDEFGPGGQEALELGVLIAVGRVDVDVQPGMPVLRLVVADEEDRRLRAAEPFARSYLDADPLFAIEFYEVQDLAPEPRQHLEVAALEHELTDTACH